MKAHRYFAILVFIAAALWVLTGEFSSVGSAQVQQDDGQDAQGTIAMQDSAGDDSANRASPDDGLMTVGVMSVPHIDHPRTIRISGVTEADKTTRLVARENGVVATLPARKGQRVSKGDIILTLESEGRDAAVRSARQVVEQRKAEVEARRTLVERGTLPKLQLDTDLSALRAAEADLEAKVAELDRLDVTAPFDGIINNLDVEIGSAVQPGAQVATLIALDPIIGKGEVNEGDLVYIETGGDASIRLLSGEVLDGTITFISQQADPVTRTFTTEVAVANPDYAVPSGMTIEVILRGDKVKATPLPRSVITLDEDGDLGVRVVDNNDTVAFYPIDILDDGTEALMLQGIPENARIIVVGQNFVTEGQTVKAAPADEDALRELAREALGETSTSEEGTLP